MKRWIFENLGLKALALLIAFSLWAYVGSRQVLERKVTLHLQLNDIPAGMTVDSNVKSFISVVLNGRKESVLDIDPEEITAVVSLKGFVPGQKEMVVHPKVQPLPNGVTATVTDLTVPLSPLADPKPALKKKTGKKP